jgi:hypothetical protein
VTTATRSISTFISVYKIDDEKKTERARDDIISLTFRPSRRIRVHRLFRYEHLHKYTYIVYMDRAQLSISDQFSRYSPTIELRTHLHVIAHTRAVPRLVRTYLSVRVYFTIPNVFGG